MSEWYENLRDDEFSGKHVRVTLANGITVEGSIASSEVLAQNHMYHFVKMNTAPFAVWFGNKLNESTGDIIILLESAKDGSWEPCSGVKKVDLVWDEREYDQIPVDQIKAFDYVVFNGHIFQVVQAMQPFVSIAVDSIVMYARLDKSMISTALRRRSSIS
ncbi:MAG: hypothetical protein [Caudoviricetes sp.]|nr:MAG: hypothetical protein [Caudoviricetes sp.]